MLNGTHETDGLRESRHLHTHHGAAMRHIHSPDAPRDASQQILSTALNGVNEHFAGDTLRVEDPMSRSASLDGRQSKRYTTASRSSSVESQRILKDEKDKEMRTKAEAAIAAYTTGNRAAASELAEIARNHGLHPSIRGKAWVILLATHPFAQKDAAKNLTTCPSPVSEHGPAEIPLKRIRGELSRYHRRRRGKGYVGTPPQSSSPRPESRASTWSNVTTPGIADPEMVDRLALDSAIELALVSYLDAHPQVPYSPGMIYVALTLADWIYTPPRSTDPDPFDFCCPALTTAFSQMMAIITWYPAATVAKLRHKPSTAEDEMDEILTRRMSHFLSIFRKLMPELDSYFDEEEANGIGEEWVRNWIQWWCARELQKNDKARLWDLYLGYRSSNSLAAVGQHTPDDSSASIDLSDGDGEDEAPPRPKDGASDAYSPFDWHPYVCLGLLKCCKDAVEELELSEIRTLLGRLPDLGNMDAIIKEAGKMRGELQVLGEKENEEAARRGAALA